METPSAHGTEKNGSLHPEYCTWCYHEGHFVRDPLSLAEMQALVRERLQKGHYPEGLIEEAVKSLNHLKRWKHWRSDMQILF